MEEMIDETMQLEDDEELEEEADAEVDKVLFELTDGKLGQAGSVGTELPVGAVFIPLSFFVDTANSSYKTMRKRKKSGDRWSSTENSSMDYSVVDLSHSLGDIILHYFCT